MIDIFGPVKMMMRIGQISIDNWVFHLHYRYTVIMLVCFTLLVTSTQYFGDPIDCVIDTSIKLNVDNYCWIFPTYTVARKSPGLEAYPGVSNYIEGEDPIKEHKYYQWVPIVLTIQAGLFYVTRFFWKSWEGDRVKNLVMDMHYPIISNENKVERKDAVVDYMMDHMNSQNLYPFQYFFCEILNFLNVSAQIYFVDYFLDGEFTHYGLKVFTEGASDETMSRVFPKITKCIFRMYGPSGSINKLDALCMLSLNIINEKIYAVMWVVFWFVAVCSAINILYRMFVFCVPPFRLLLLKATCHMAFQDEILTLHKKFQIGDWFLMYQLSKNINPFILREIVSELAVKVKEKELKRNV